MIKPDTEHGTPYIDICYDADQIGIIYAINIINMEGHRDNNVTYSLQGNGNSGKTLTHLHSGH